MEHNFINYKQSEYDKQEKERFIKTVDKINKLASTYSKIIVIQCSQVGSFQLQKIRKNIRGEAEIVRGKVVRLCFDIILKLFPNNSNIYI